MRYTAPAGQAGLLSFRRAWKQVPLPVVQPQTKQNQISITMKKTLITLLALAGIAMGETLLPDLLKGDGTPNMNWLVYTSGTNIAGLTGKDTNALTIQNATNLFKNSDLDEAGWHAQIGGAQNGGLAYGVDTKVVESNKNASEQRTLQ